MRFLLILLLIPFIGSSQDSTIVTNQSGETIRFITPVTYVTAQNGDSIIVRNTASKKRGLLALADLKTYLQLNNVSNTSDATERAASAVLTNKTLATFNYAADAGANDSYSISLNPSPGAYTTGMVVFFKANTVNTGAASINVNGLGAKTIVKRVNTALANGDIPSQALCMLIYDGTNFILLNPVVN